MNLIIDVGNTTAKITTFSNGNFLKQRRVEIQSWEQLDAEPEIANAEKVLLSSVRDIDQSWLETFRKKVKLLLLEWDTPIPLKLNYTTPKTLGSDRLANAVGAGVLYPDSNILVIDFGTCIKYDFVLKGNSYEGGAISPGLNMRFKALHNFTDKLPLVSYSSNFPLVGKNTQDSIGSGVVNGIIAEVQFTIDLYRQQFPDLKVVATGGDQYYFDNFFKNSIFAHHFLTALGLHEILIYNL